MQTQQLAAALTTDVRSRLFASMRTYLQAPSLLADTDQNQYHLLFFLHVSQLVFLFAPQGIQIL